MTQHHFDNIFSVMVVENLINLPMSLILTIGLRMETL